MRKIKVFKTMLLFLLISGIFLVPNSFPFQKAEAAAIHVWEVYSVATGISGYNEEFDIKLSTYEQYHRSASGYTGYTFDKNKGIFQTSGNYYSDIRYMDAKITDGDEGKSYVWVLYVASGDTLYQYSNHTYAPYSGKAIMSSQSQVKKAAPIIGKVKGEFVEITTSSTKQFPDNGEYNGKWYVYKGITNIPTITLSTPNNQQLSEVSGYNILNISGTAKDADVGDIVKVRYSIDGVPSHQNRELIE